MLEILGEIHINPDITIYVRNKYENFWTNKEINEKELEVIIKRIENSKTNYDKIDREDLEIANAKYHCNFKPISNSDLVYEWEKT